jgi:hypothetical protein
MAHTGFFVTDGALDRLVTHYLWTGTQLQAIETRGVWRDRR